VGGVDPTGDQVLVFAVRIGEVRARASGTDADRLHPRHRQQAVGAAGGAVAARVAAAEGESRVGGRHNHVVDDHDPGVDALGECLCDRRRAEHRRPQREGVEAVAAERILAVLDDDRRELGGDPFQSALEFGGVGGRHEHPARRDAGAPRVEPGAEGDGPFHQIEIGPRQHEDRVAARQLQDGRHARQRAPSAYLRAGLRRPGKDHEIGAGVDRRFGLRWVAPDQLQRRLRQSRFVTNRGKRRQRSGVTRRRLDDHGVARGQRLDRLDRGQKQRVVARGDDQHHAVRVALQREARAPQPQWPALPHPARSQEALGVGRAPLQCIAKRQYLGGQRFGALPPVEYHGGGHRRRAVGQQPANSGKNPQSPAHRHGGPITCNSARDLNLLQRWGRVRSVLGRWPGLRINGVHGGYATPWSAAGRLGWGRLTWCGMVSARSSHARREEMRADS
jgi:hypothetical protein